MQLRSLGVAVDLRQKMHEKIAFIDGSVVWVGSLNIMSHRDTTEFMIRIPSQAACTQISEFVKAPRRGPDGVPAFWTAENPACEPCGAPMVWKTGRYGVYFECPECGEKLDLRRRMGSSRRRREGRVRR